jgi:hypothetical protein
MNNTFSEKTFSLPYRQIHLDFHTSPHILDVGQDFDPRKFARKMKESNINSVTVFAKCHHGMLYYDTQRPERHPGLPPGLNLLKEQVDALHAEGIRAPIYISIQVDEYSAQTHPEWLVINPDGTIWKGWGSNQVFKPGWHVLDMSSPYQDFVAEQTGEILEKFKPVDGIFFDMCWDQPSASVWAIRGMKNRGMNPQSSEDRDEYARLVALEYMQLFFNLVKASSSEATIYFNGRSITDLAQDIPYLEQVEIEALPTGGWGYMYFPVNVRYARTFPKPYMGMTGRFHKSWGDFGGLKPYAALEYETSQMMAHGARCSIGDQLHPRGTLDPAAYQRIAQVYQRVKDREPWLEGAKSIAQIGLFKLPTSSLRNTQNTSRTDEGATRMLTQLKHQFDVVKEDSYLENYEMLILPDSYPMGEPLVKRISQYLENGGKLLVTGASALTADATQSLLPGLGILPQGFSPFSVTYIQFGESIKFQLLDTDHVVYEHGIRAIPGEGTVVLARVVEPYFERTWEHFCSHNQTPPSELTPYLAASIRKNVAYISYPIFRLYAEYGNESHRILVKKLVDLLLPEPLLRVEGPTGLETSVSQQGARTIVHLLFYTPERRAPGMDLVEDIIPLHQVPLSIKLAQPPQKVYTAPEMAPLPLQYKDSYAHIVVPEVRGHAMVIFE